MKKLVIFDVKSYEKEYFDSLVLDGYQILQIEASFQVAFDDFYEQIKDAEIISVFTSSRVRADNLKMLKNLKLIATRSTGFNHIDTTYCKETGIEVVNVPKYGNCTVAEYAFALLLSVAKKVRLSSDDLRKDMIIPDNYIGIDLFGKNIGVIGTGAIGAHFCKIAKGFGMQIFAYDPYPKAELESELDVKYVELNELLKRSDIISMHAPSTASNVHMLNYEQFDLMKDGVLIVNTARGELINVEALYQALLNGKVMGAGLDVVECEELLGPDGKFFIKIDCKLQSCMEKTFINHKLLNMENVVLTPHVAYDTKEAIDRILVTTDENIKAFVYGGKIKNSVL